MKTRWFLMVCAFSGISSIATAADWPQWRGPQRNGISPETGLLATWPKDGPKLLWKLADVGDGYGAPAVAGSRLYLLGNRGIDNEFVQALSVQDGATVWSTRLGSVGFPDQQPSYPKARSTPTLDGDRLYALSSAGDLACLESATGKILWHKSLRTDFGGEPGTWAYAESPLIDGDVLVATPGGRQTTMVALNKKTGAVIWRSLIPGKDLAAYASVIVVEAAGRRQYVNFLGNGVVGLDAKTGQFLWRYDQTAKGPANIPTPVAHDGYVYSTNSRRFGGALVQLHATSDGVGAEQVYFGRDMPNTLGGQILLGKYLYGTNSAGMAAAEFVSGKVQWQVEGIGPGAVLYADGHLYLHGENNEVALIEASPESYREKGRFTLPDQPKHRTMERAWAYPVVANGQLYLRDVDRLWCYSVSAAPAGKER
jgi:outer membrane protein assembly factor BamB